MGESHSVYSKTWPWRPHMCHFFSRIPASAMGRTYHGCSWTACWSPEEDKTKMWSRAGQLSNRHAGTKSASQLSPAQASQISAALQMHEQKENITLTRVTGWAAIANQHDNCPSISSKKSFFKIIIFVLFLLIIFNRSYFEKSLHIFLISLLKRLTDFPLSGSSLNMDEASSLRPNVRRFDAFSAAWQPGGSVEWTRTSSEEPHPAWLLLPG